MSAAALLLLTQMMGRSTYLRRSMNEVARQKAARGKVFEIAPAPAVADASELTALVRANGGRRVSIPFGRQDMELRDLVADAAQAAGIKLKWSTSPAVAPTREDTGEIWNPRWSNGDAFELAARLKLAIVHTLDSLPAVQGAVMVGYAPMTHGGAPMAVERYNGRDDRCHAARLAVLRAAAMLKDAGRTKDEAATA